MIRFALAVALSTVLAAQKATSTDPGQASPKAVHHPPHLDRSGKTRKGNTELGEILTECAWAAGRTNTYVGAQFRRFHRRFGKKGGRKAAIATAHTLIVIIWHVLAESTAYRDLGADYFTRRFDNPEARKRRLIRELEALGNKVIIEPNAA